MKAEMNQSTPGRGKRGRQRGMMALRRVILGGFLLAALAGGMEAEACFPLGSIQATLMATRYI